MKAFSRAGAAAGAALAALVPSLAAHAGGMKAGGTSCNCTVAPPPPCNCNVPTGHQVNVPGVNITAPSVTVVSPTIFVGGANVQVQASSVASAQADAQSSASASASGEAAAQGMAQAYGAPNAVAAANALGFALGAGGGGGFASSAAVANSYIPALTVESAETRQVCAERDVTAGYEGELFRCIAGARMQYTLADYAGSADFARGQTVSCLKGEALYHAAGGAVACRPQKPARDCNERSLLRRYGAGIKVLTLASARQCVSYRSETAEGSAAGAGGALQLDGGVGGTY